MDTLYYGRFRSAGIPLPLGLRRKKADKFGVFALLSWANHACHHNAHHAWNEKLGAVTVYALKDIEVDEQITINYNPANIVDPERLLAMYNIKCRCEWCYVFGPGRQEADLAHKNVNEWSTLIHKEKEPGKAVRYAYMAFTEMLEQGIKDNRYGLLFADALDVAVHLGCADRARVLGRLACGAYVFCEGKESDHGAILVKALTEFRERLEGQGVDVGGDRKGKGKAVAVVEDDAGEGGEDDKLPTLSPGLTEWLAAGKKDFKEKINSDHDAAFRWLFMSEIWPKDQVPLEGQSQMASDGQSQTNSEGQSQTIPGGDTQMTSNGQGQTTSDGQNQTTADGDTQMTLDTDTPVTS